MFMFILLHVGLPFIVVLPRTLRISVLAVDHPVIHVCLSISIPATRSSSSFYCTIRPIYIVERALTNIFPLQDPKATQHILIDCKSSFHLPVHASSNNPHSRPSCSVQDTLVRKNLAQSHLVA